MVDTFSEDALVAVIKERLGVKTLAAVIINLEGDDIYGYDKMVSALANLSSYTFVPKKLKLDLKNEVTLPTRPSIKEPHVLKLKVLPS